MTTIQKYILGIISLVVLVVGIHSFGGKSTAGDATVSNYPTWYYNGIVVGPDNTLIKQETLGSCPITNATSTPAFGLSSISCAAASSKVGDAVFLEPTNATSTFNITAAFVTTAGTITAKVTNGSNATSTPSGRINWLIFR